MSTPLISLVVLARDNLELTRACVESLRTNTDVSSELIIVDNGSAPDASTWAAENADRSVLNRENRGFAIGMNQGLAEATGELVAFINNDTVFPEKWASRIVETLRSHPTAGIVAPAVTAAGNPATVRTEPGTEVVVFEPFGHLPSGVVYVMRTDQCRQLGGWNEDYTLATGEDLDLLFTIWTNDLDVVLDERVLVRHVSEATRRTEPAMDERLKVNLAQFLTRWERGEPQPPRLPACPVEVFHRNLRHAAAAAIWLRRLTDARRVPAERSSGEIQLRRLERDLERATDQLNAERAKREALLRRRSVKLALAASKSMRPLVRRMRSRHRRPGPDPQRALTERIRQLRPDDTIDSGPLVSIVVLNRDGAHHLARLLPGLADDTAYRSFELIVVDNASIDDSRAVLDQEWGFPIRVIHNERNVSFSEGCNQGVATANGELVLLLNNDISPINRGWLGAMVGALQADPTCGAAGALLVYPQRPGYRSGDPNTGADLTVQHAGVHIRWRRSDDPGGVVPWGYNLGVGTDPTDPGLVPTIEVPAATAACLLVRADLLARLGGLDEGYRYGVEDVELCLRLRRSGHRIVVVGEAALYHHEFGTQSKTAAEQKRLNGMANLQHFAETWGPDLSRMLDLEALATDQQPLRHRSQPLTVVVADDTASPAVAAAVEGLATSLRQEGRRTERRVTLDEGEEAAVVVSTSPSLDVRAASTDVLTVAWILDRFDAWTTALPAYRVTVPSTPDIADHLLATGAMVTDVVDARVPQDLTAAVGRFLERWRLSVLVDSGSIGRGRALAVALNRHGLRASVVTPEAWEAPAAQCVDAVVTTTEPGGPSLKASHLNILWRPGPASATDGGNGYDVVITAASVDEVAAAVVRAMEHTPSRRAASGETWRPIGSLPT